MVGAVGAFSMGRFCVVEVGAIELGAIEVSAVQVGAVERRECSVEWTGAVVTEWRTLRPSLLV